MISLWFRFSKPFMHARAFLENLFKQYANVKEILVSEQVNWCRMSKLVQTYAQLIFFPTGIL